MTAGVSLFRRVDDARARLGNPATVWFRGHAARHRLVPAFFRFPGGVEAEHDLYEAYRRQGGQEVESTDPWTTLVGMHDSYLPTRLLAWTESFGLPQTAARPCR